MSNAKIIAWQSFPKQSGSVPMSVVLRDLGGYHPFVTHCRNNDDGSFFWGHYFKDLEAARKDFTERCERYQGTPRWKHDCESCTFLGSYEGYDLYHHLGTVPVFIARQSDDGPDYLSDSAPAESSTYPERLTGPLLEAKRRAQDRGLRCYHTLKPLTEADILPLQQDDGI